MFIQTVYTLYYMHSKNHRHWGARPGKMILIKDKKTERIHLNANYCRVVPTLFGQFLKILYSPIQVLSIAGKYPLSIPSSSENPACMTVLQP